MKEQQKRDERELDRQAIREYAVYLSILDELIALKRTDL